VTLLAFAAVRRAAAAPLLHAGTSCSNPLILPARGTPSSKPAVRCFSCRQMGQTDRRTDRHCTVTQILPHTMRAVSIIVNYRQFSSQRCERTGLYYSAPIGEQSIVMSVSVCVFVHDHIFGTTPNFLCMLPMAVARSSSGGVVICYVLSVLWMTSCLLMSQGCSTSPPS